MSIQRGNTKLELADVVDVCRTFGISESTLAKWIKQGCFPVPFRVGLRKRVWLKRTVTNHLENMAAEAAGKQK